MLIHNSSATSVPPVSSHTNDQKRDLDRRVRRHWEMLVVSLTVMAMALMMRVRPDQKVELVFLPDWPAPETCLSRAFWNISCPGCGLTRSFIHLADGNLPASLAVNRIGWLLALATVLQIPFRIGMLHWLSKRGLPEPIPRYFNTLFARTLIVALIGQWFVQMLQP